MHLYETGKDAAEPLVVLEAGAGAFSFDWYLVQQEVAKFARVCSYDRAGHAWSDLGPRPHTLQQAAHDLHEFLGKAGLRRRVVLVGHSLGGALVRIYQAQYPQDVAGMVLVESPPELMAQNVNGKVLRPCDWASGRPIPAVREQLAYSDRVLAKAELDGIAQFRRIVGAPTIDPPYEKLPQSIQALRLWALGQPAVVVADYNEYGPEELLCLFADRVRRPVPLGNLPLVVLTRSPQKQHAGAAAPTKSQVDRDRERVEGCRSMAAMSSNSIFLVADSTLHELHVDEPQIVVKAIRAVVHSVRTGSKLKSLK
jgi:pimeloyl-ACP methyl ester carboxylesterase